MSKITSNQPEPVKQKLYGSKPVEPLHGVSNQPDVLPHIKVYGHRTTATVRVKLKGIGGDGEMIINESDFDPDRHERSA